VNRGDDSRNSFRGILKAVKQTVGPAPTSKTVGGKPMTDDPKVRDGQSTPEELMEIHKGVDQDTPTKEEAEELEKEFGDKDEESAA
jgi:hypothetical protein